MANLDEPPPIRKEDELPDLEFIKEETKKAAVTGEFCEHSDVCPGVDLNCMQTKIDRGCWIYEGCKKYGNPIEYFAYEVGEFRNRGEDVSNLEKSLKLARENMKNGRYGSVRSHLELIKTKIEKGKFALSS